MDSPDGYARNGDVEIAYWDRGRGPNTVLLIMGVLYRSAFWRKEVVEALAKDFRVVLFDNRGTGYSTKPVEALTAELWAADALAVLTPLPLADTRGAFIGSVTACPHGLLAGVLGAA